MIKLIPLLLPFLLLINYCKVQKKQLTEKTWAQSTFVKAGPPYQFIYYKKTDKNIVIRFWDNGDVLINSKESGEHWGSWEWGSSKDGYNLLLNFADETVRLGIHELNSNRLDVSAWSEEVLPRAVLSFIPANSTDWPSDSLVEILNSESIE